MNQFDSTVAKGSVIKTNPAAGTQVKANTGVTVYVSMGEDEQPIVVPKLLGMTVSQAQTTLTNLKLKYEVKEVGSSEPKGTVLSQSVPEGSTVSEASLVVIEVSNGIPANRTLTFTANIPSNASEHHHYFTFKILMDGVVKKTEEVNVSATSNYKFTLTGSVPIHTIFVCWLFLEDLRKMKNSSFAIT